MAKKKRIEPTEQDEHAVRQIVLSGLASGDDLVEIADRLSAFHPVRHTFPAETLLDLAADAVADSGATRAEPLEFGYIRERFMPELHLTKKHDHYKSKWAIRAAAMIHAGVDPGLDEELDFWHQDDLWQWALDAVVVYVRAAASYRQVDAAAVAQALAAIHRVSSLDGEGASAANTLRPTWAHNASD